jgi:hypothetical protein
MDASSKIYKSYVSVDVQHYVSLGNSMSKQQTDATTQQLEWPKSKPLTITSAR